jgi:hypothetical protein
MLENIIIASTNLYGIIAYPYCTSFEQTILLLAIVTSTIYHVIEKHKQGMTGLPVFNGLTAHTVFLNIDRMCALITFCTFFDYDHMFEPKIIMCLCTGLFMMYLAEMVYRDPVHKYNYIFTHCAWHILAYHTIYLVKHNSMCYNAQELISNQ